MELLCILWTALFWVMRVVVIYYRRFGKPIDRLSQTSVRNYYYLLHNNPWQRSSQLLHGRSLQSHILCVTGRYCHQCFWTWEYFIQLLKFEDFQSISSWIKGVLLWLVVHAIIKMHFLDFSFMQWWQFRIWSSGLCQYVASYVSSSIMVELAASIFRVGIDSRSLIKVHSDITQEKDHNIKLNICL